MEAFFTELGQLVLARWKLENFSLDAFPAIAHSALTERPPATHVDLAELMRRFLLHEQWPSQTDSPFGEPEIVAFSHSRFYIQLLFWLDGTTAIHQHEFSGAFHVMAGSSIHAEYAFDRARAVTPYLRLGELRLKSMELLETGITVPIASGAKHIHSLFHLDSPSVTVVVRTQHDPGTGPQLNYLPPGVAVDPHHRDLLAERRLQVLDVLERVEDPAYAELVMQMIAELDFERAFHLLRHCMQPLQALDAWPNAMKAFETRHGKLAEPIEKTLREEVRRSTIKGLRSTIIEPEHRFFLALLMSAPTRADLLALVKQRFPRQKAIDVVLRWVEELMEASESGVSVLDAWFPEAIDVESEAQPELLLAALRHFMQEDKKAPAALRRLSSGDVAMLRQALAESALSLLVE